MFAFATQTAVGILDRLGLPPGVILQLPTVCAEGVEVASQTPASFFTVELFVGDKDKRSDSGAASGGARAVRAIAAAFAPLVIDLEWVNYACKRGGREVWIACLECPTRKLQGVAVGNALAAAFEGTFDRFTMNDVL